ncbi:hypothetical protein PWJ66_18420 [Lysinibacillus fusiformis]|nr:hypothetical protein PWJ66_18420 [Lysinibacillus fusiformis]
MNNMNKLRKRKRDLLSKQDEAKFKFYISKMEEYSSYNGLDDYLNSSENKLKAPKGDLIILTEIEGGIKWEVEESVGEYLESVLRIADRSLVKDLVSAIIGDIKISILKKLYLSIITKIQNSTNISTDKDDFFYFGSSGLTIVREIYKNIEDETKFDEFTGKKEKNFSVEKANLPIVLFQVYKLKANKRILKIVDDRESLNKFFSLNCIDNFNSENCNRYFVDKLSELLDFNWVLNEIKEAYAKENYKLNSSLNFMLFNELTSIYDLYIFSKAILDDNFYKMLRYKKESDEKINFKKVLLGEYYSLNGLGLKTKLINDTDFLEIINIDKIKKISKLIKRLEKQFEKELVEKFVSPNEMKRKEYILYDILKNEDPLEFLMEDLELNIKGFIGKNEQLNDEVLDALLIAHGHLRKKR